jgi:hypothetical protein
VNKSLISAFSEGAALLAGLGMLALGAYQEANGAQGALGLMTAGAGILIAASHSNKWLAAVVAKAPEIESGLETADKFLPLVPFLPPQYQALAHTLLGDTEAALKALVVPAKGPGETAGVKL